MKKADESGEKPYGGKMQNTIVCKEGSTALKKK